MIFYSLFPERFLKNHKEFQITIPSVLDNDGKFVSHVLHESHRNSRTEQKGNGVNRGTSEEQLLHLEVPTFDGEKLRLRLHKNTKFTAPGLVIEDGSQVRQHNLDCHYTGHITDQPNSLVSLSYCQGLVSYKVFSF